MSINSFDRGPNNDAITHKQVILSEGVVCDPNGSIVAMNGDIEEGAQLYICHPEEEGSLQSQRERKRSNHNSIEKKRKEKIRYFINKIGELLPPINNPEKEKIGRSTLDIVEKAYDYIQQLKEERTSPLPECDNPVQAQELSKLKEELEAVKQERDQLSEQLKQAGLAVVCGSPGQWNQKNVTQDAGGGNSNVIPGETVEGDSSKLKSHKTKKRNTISVQLENMKKQQQTQIMGSMSDTSGLAGNFPGMNNMMMGPNGQQVMGGANVMMNQMMVNGNTVIMPNTMGGLGNMPNQLPGQPLPGVMTTVSGQQNQDALTNSSSEAAGAGLLQLAMQDAGITPGANSQGQTSEESAATTSSDGGAASQTSSALQTLASVATVSQQTNVSACTAPTSQALSSSLVSQSGSALTATTQAINSNMPIMATGQNGMSQMMPGNNMMNMSFMNSGQQGFGGNVIQGGQQLQGAQQPGFNTTLAAPQGQFMFINEHGVPCIANVPLGIDPNTLGLANFQKQVVGMDKSGNVVTQGFGNMMPTQGLQKDQVNDPTLLANLTLQGQQQFQQNAVAMGATGALMQQSVNNPLSLNQQIMQPLQTQFNPQGQQGLIVPVSQNGGLLTVNSATQNQQQNQSQLPQALILPNGQIIPVVTNPQMHTAPVNGGNPLLQTNAQWQSQTAPQHPGAAARMNVPQGLQNNAILSSGVDGNTTAMPSSSGQIQVGQPPVAFTQPQGSMGLLMTTTSTVQGSSIISSSSQTTAQVSASTSLCTDGGKKITESTLMQDKGHGMGGLVRFPGQDVDLGDQGSNQATNIVGMNSSSVSSHNLNNNMPMSVIAPQGQIPGTLQGQGQIPGTMPSQGQVAGTIQNTGTANGPILLTMNVNGQLTSVLVDPTTMQVLGTGQTPQQPQNVPQPPLPNPQPPPPPQQPQTTSPGIANTTNKKGKKNNQRAICPKPSAKDDDGDPSQTQAPAKKSKSKSKSKSSKANSNPSDVVPQQEESSSCTTDILAKAAESIFSSDISPPISGFYNPANEDNPLQIDTSAGETEEDPEGGNSPRKEMKGGLQKGEVKVNVADKGGKENVTQNVVRPVQETAVVSDLPQNQISNFDNVLEGALGMSVTDAGDLAPNVAQPVTQAVMQSAPQGKDKSNTMDVDAGFSVPTQVDNKKSNKRSRKSDKEKASQPEKEQMSDADLANTVKEIINNVKASTPASTPKKSSSKKSKKQAPVEQPLPSTGVGTEEEPAIVLPETITFSEKDLSDVLDQVESLGSSLSDTGAQTPTPPKKSKNKKSRVEVGDASEPASKKRKKSGKSNKSGSDNAKSKDSLENSSKSSMSVYDFDEEGPDDFSSPLFKPLHQSRNLGTNSQTASSNSTAETTPRSSQSSKYAGKSDKPTVTDTESSSILLGVNNEPLNYDRPLFDTNPPPPVETPSVTKKDKSKSKRSKHKNNKDANVPESKSSVKNSEQNSDAQEMFGFEDVDTNIGNMKSQNIEVPSAKVSVSEQTQKSDFNQFDQTIDINKQGKEKDKIDMSTDKGPVHSTPKKKAIGLGSDLQSLEIASSNAQNNSIEQTPLSTTSSQHVLHADAEEARNSPVHLSITEPVHISTSSDASDIDNTMNSLLGLSPHIITQGQQNNTTLSQQQQQQRSPQLQTPKSTSPVSLTSLQSTQQPPLPPSVLMSSSSNDLLVSCASSVAPSATNFSTSGDMPYSAESLFNTADKSAAIVARSSVHKTDVEGMYEKANIGSKNRSNGIYSADNFVQSNKVDSLRDSLRTEKSVSSNQVNVISPPLSSAINRLPNENSSEAFNFASMGLNLSTPSTSANSIMDSLSMSPIISTVSNSTVTTTSSFTFTLSSVTSTSTTSSASMSSHPSQNMHPFPFYSPQNHHNAVSSATSNLSQTNLINNNNPPQPPTQEPLSMPNFDLDLGNNGGSHLNHPPSQKRQPNDRVPPPHMATSQDQLFYGLSDNRSSCSVQNQSREPQEQPPMIPNITVSSHSGLSKSQTDQMRNTHKRMQDLNQSSGRNVGGGQKSSSSGPESRTNSMDRSQQFSMNNVQPFFSPPHLSNASSQSTHPLSHPPLTSNEERSNIGSNRLYDPIFPPHSQSFSTGSQSFNGSRYDGNVMQPFPHQRESGGGTQPLSHTPPSHNQDGRKSANPKSGNKPQHQVNSNPPSQSRAISGPPPPSHSSGPTPPHQPPSHRPTPPQAQQQPSHHPPSQTRQPKSSSSRSKQSQKKNKHQMYTEMESPFSHGMFDSNRSLTPFFGFPPQNLSPPARNIQNEGPGLFTGNLFGAGQRHNASSSVPKNADISAPFNPLFPTGRPQNGLGQNFLPGFGMNSVHGGMSNAGSITPHSGSVTVTPHMSNFSLTNIFSDNSQSDSLNISPIKFPHSNAILPPQGVDPNSLQHPHHHQGSSIYHHHNRSHPPPPVIHNAMSINSILGHNHHSFDARGMPQGMNTSVAPPFPGAGHPPSFAMPPLNFSMHDP